MTAPDETTRIMDRLLPESAITPTPGQPDCYDVASQHPQRQGTVYRARYDHEHGTCRCDCPARAFRGNCAHLRAVRFWRCVAGSARDYRTYSPAQLTRADRWYAAQAQTAGLTWEERAAWGALGDEIGARLAREEAVA